MVPAGIDVIPGRFDAVRTRISVLAERLGVILIEIDGRPKRLGMIRASVWATRGSLPNGSDHGPHPPDPDPGLSDLGLDVPSGIRIVPSRLPGISSGRPDMSISSGIASSRVRNVPRRPRDIPGMPTRSHPL
jgi:hypothetical protein